MLSLRIESRNRRIQPGDVIPDFETEAHGRRHTDIQPASEVHDEVGLDFSALQVVVVDLGARASRDVGLQPRGDAGRVEASPGTRQEEVHVGHQGLTGVGRGYLRGSERAVQLQREAARGTDADSEPERGGGVELRAVEPDARAVIGGDYERRRKVGGKESASTECGDLDPFRLLCGTRVRDGQS